MLMHTLLSMVVAMLVPPPAPSDDPGFMTAVPLRETIPLDGTWRVLVDPQDSGALDFLGRPTNPGWGDAEGRLGPMHRVEHAYTDAATLEVPGDWNTQREALLFYEGSVWYQRDFEIEPGAAEGVRTFLRFGGANALAWVYLNGQLLGTHGVGFTPFEFEVTGKLRDGANDLVVRVDNRRRRDGVPGMRFDWWNYGGLTRRVDLIHVPMTFVRDAQFGLTEDGAPVSGWVRLDGPNAADTSFRVVVGEGEDAREVSGQTDEHGLGRFEVSSRGLALWTPESPSLHPVRVEAGGAVYRERVGLRTIETRGGDVLLNGERVFLRGICIHEEAPTRDGRAWTQADARELLIWAKQLGCNYVRLAHYPHNEAMVRMADEMGLLVWAEIPVYWTLEYANPEALEEARTHLREMIARDKNRASVIIWSVGNETGYSDEGVAFRTQLGEDVRRLDPSRLLSAALFARQVREKPGNGKPGSIDARLTKLVVEDPFGASADILAINTYIGWYHDRPDEIGDIAVELAWDKPIVLSEFGAGVKHNLRGPKEEVWTEDYGVWLYENTLAWSESIPNIAGLSPWILKDFRSPRRPLAGVQDYRNRKGLVTETGEKKLVFDVVRRHYERIAAREEERAHDPTGE